GGIEWPPVLLDVLTVVALRAGESEQPLLDDRVVAVPHRQSEAQVLPAIADTTEAVLPPAIRPRSRVVVREVVPRGTTRAVVLSDGSPLPRRQVRTPPLPPRFALTILVQPLLLRIAAHGRTVGGFVTAAVRRILKNCSTMRATEPPGGGA